MTEAKATWVDNFRFVAEASSGHSVVVDGDKKTAGSPMELVLIGLCGCTGYDVASILRKKREPFTSLEVRALAERAADPPSVYTDIKQLPGGRQSIP
jgi:putative redox protein